MRSIGKELDRQIREEMREVGSPVCQLWLNAKLAAWYLINEPWDGKGVEIAMKVLHERHRDPETWEALANEMRAHCAESFARPLGNIIPPEFELYDRLLALLDEMQPIQADGHRTTRAQLAAAR